MTEKQIKEMLMELLGDYGHRTEDYQDYGLLTRDEGLVLFVGKQEFTITINEMQGANQPLSSEGGDKGERMARKSQTRSDGVVGIHRQKVEREGGPSL